MLALTNLYRMSSPKHDLAIRCIVESDSNRGMADYLRLLLGTMLHEFIQPAAEVPTSP